MKISRISVRNFRSIKECDLICSNFNIFVGQNNCGKTNLFEAMEWFYSGKGTIDEIFFNKNRTNEVTVEVTFVGAQEGASKMKNPSNQTKIKDALGNSDEITVKRSSTDIKKRTTVVDGKEVKTGTGFDAALNDFLPRFEYIHTKQYFESVSKYDKKTPVGIMLSGVLSTILEKNVQYIEFQKRFQDLFEDDESVVKIEFDSLGSKVQLNLEKQFPDCTKVRFEVTAPEFDDLLKNFETHVDDGIETTAAEKGDGMQRALMLAIIQAYAEFRRSNEDIGKSFLFFIDEAELHLHPSAQRKLKKVLLDLAKHTDQVFINTHSSVLVADNDEDQRIHVIEKTNGESSFLSIGDRDKSYVVYELLGGSPSDLLLPNNFLIVEGISEVEFLNRVISRHYPEKTLVQIVPADGDQDQAERTVNSIEKAFSPLKKSIYREKVVVLCDKPAAQRQAGFDDFVNRNSHLRSNNQIHILTEQSLEESYPETWKRTAAEVKAMNGDKKKKLAKKVGEAISKEDFETQMPVLFQALSKAWESAFKS